MILLWIGATSAFGQITDDSTELVYGAYTTFYTHERLLKNNQDEIYQNPDTTVYEFEKFNRVDASNRQYQGLGFLGTPLFDLDYNPPEEAGRQFGFSGYDAYFKDPSDIKYFDTKSPFMDLKVVLGGNNRTKIDVGFARNVNEHMNVGFNINRITADKQIGAENLGDRSTESSSFDIFLHYRNSEKPYQIAYSFTTLKHQISDIGGVDVPADSTRADFFQYDESETLLNDATTIDQRNRHHLYHEYRLGSGFQLYHQSDYITQEYGFTDFGTRDEFEQFYPRILIGAEEAANDTTLERSNFREFKNEAGIKGNIKGAFYRFYAKRRDLRYDTKFILEKTTSEMFAGAYLRFDWNDKFSVTGQGEISQEGAYKLNASLQNNLITAEYTSVRSLPDYLIREYSGNHHQWDTDFSAQFSNKLSARLNVRWNDFQLQPRASVTTLTNYVYFSESQEAAQADGTIILNQAGGNFSVDFLRGFSVLQMSEDEYFRLENDVTLTQTAGGNADLINTPTIRYAGRLFWKGNWFQDAVPIEIGGDVYYRSSYFGNAYDPVLSRFYLQDDIELRSYIALDIFVNMKIRNLRAFVKWTHFNQQVNDGYMVTPYFPGQGSVLDLGVQWLFFD